MNTQQQNQIKAADLIDSLPTHGKMEALEHLFKTLEEKDLHELSVESRQRLLSIFPEVPTGKLELIPPSLSKKGQFSKIYSGTTCELEVRSTRLGQEVRLTLNGGLTFEEIFDEINSEGNRRYERNIIGRSLYEDANVENEIKRKTVLSFIPVIRKSENLVKFGINNSHEALLKKHNFDFVDRPLQAVAAGAYRLAKGFNTKFIGHPQDEGDLFRGFVARSRSFAIGTSSNLGLNIGLTAHSDYNDYYYPHLVVSGGSFLS